MVANIIGKVGIGSITPAARLQVVNGGSDPAVEGDNTTGPGMIGSSTSGFGVLSNGFLGVTRLGTGGATALCLNGNLISFCSSSVRYKTNLAPYRNGLDIINRLRPISFDWKQGGMHDVGFGAEDVAKIEPLLITHNDKGEVEGVKYDRLSVVFVNAFKEQQSQIESLQRHVKAQDAEIDAFRSLVCSHYRKAKVCRQKN